MQFVDVQSLPPSLQRHQFVDVAALHSEILLVTKEGKQLYRYNNPQFLDQFTTSMEFLMHTTCVVVYSWKCGQGESSNPKPHPLSDKLGLTGEEIALIQSSECRVTVATTSGKLATFYDSLLRGLSLPPSVPPSLTLSLLPSLPPYSLSLSLSLPPSLPLSPSRFSRFFPSLSHSLSQSSSHRICRASRRHYKKTHRFKFSHYSDHWHWESILVVSCLSVSVYTRLSVPNASLVYSITPEMRTHHYSGHFNLSPCP